MSGILEGGEWSFPTTVLFGPGKLAQLAARLGVWGRRPLVVTDRGVAVSGVLEAVLRVLRTGGLDPVVFTGVDPNPTEQNVLDGLDAYRVGCDSLVGLGGGSAMDAAKAIRLLTVYPPPLAQYDDLLNGAARIGEGLPALVCIPTTSGTGSEVGRSTVITINGRKTVIFAPQLIANLALLDPELTLGLPPAVTAGTGADALTHNLEAYCSRGFHPLCDAIALDGVARSSRWLATAVHDGSHLEARSEMMLASAMGAIAFQKGLGAAHSLAHPLSSVCGLHHGTANAIVLPHVVRFNAPALQDRAGPLAAALGISSSGAGDIAGYLTGLFQEIQLPARLRDAGVREDQLETLADLAIQDGCHQCNPRTTSRDDLLALYRDAF